jgi:hypothetical protein
MQTLGSSIHHALDNFKLEFICSFLSEEAWKRVFSDFVLNIFSTTHLQKDIEYIFHQFAYQFF